MKSIQFFKPTLNRKDMKNVLQTMVDEQIGPGERMKDFQSLFLSLVGKQACISLRSYADALKIALLVGGAKAGTKVGISVLSPEIYLSVANNLQVELTLIDICEETGCLDYDKAIAENCEILLVHEPFGTLPVQEGFLENSPIIIEDVTESLGSTYKARKAGQFSEIMVCAFEENNTVSTGGGAIVAVNGKENVGFIKAINLEYIEMTDLNASLGIVQLKKFEERQNRRKEIFDYYQKALLKTKHKLFGLNDIDFENTGSGFSLLLNSKAENAIKFANKYEVPCKKSFENCVGKDQIKNFDKYPIGSVYIMRAINFPLYPYLSKNEIDEISKVISHLP